MVWRKTREAENPLWGEAETIILKPGRRFFRLAQKQPPSSPKNNRGYIWSEIFRYIWLHSVT